MSISNPSLSETPPMTDGALQDIRDRLVGTTPAPWKVLMIDEEGLTCIKHPHWDICTDEDSPSNVCCAITNGEMDGPEPDIEFIAHARADVEALLAEVDRLRSHAVPVVEGEDAARYRFLRGAFCGADMEEGLITFAIPASCISGMTMNPEGCDKGVDAAMSSTPAERSV